jgi:hypothetical protein
MIGWVILGTPFAFLRSFPIISCAWTRVPRPSPTGSYPTARLFTTFGSASQFCFLGSVVCAMGREKCNRSKIHLVSTGLVVYRSIRSFHYRIGTRVLTSCRMPKVTFVQTLCPATCLICMDHLMNLFSMSYTCYSVYG